MSTTTTFEYRVRDRSGKLLSGKLDAPNQAALIGRLREQGYAPLSVKQAGTGLQREITLPGGDRVGLKDLTVMARQLSTMVGAGLSLVRALAILAEQTESKPLAKVLAAARTDVEAGISLSTALARHPQVFTPLVVNMVRAGEVGGFLDTTLLSVANNLESELKLRGKIKSAMTYPAVVFVIAILAVVAMLVFVVPIFTTMFAGLGAELPLLTRVLVAASDAMLWAAPLGLVLTAVAVVMWRRYGQRPGVRARVDPLLLKVPVFGQLTRKVAISRFTRNLATMIRSGVPILQSLEVVGSASGNAVIEAAVRDVQDSVRRGESLSAPLARHPVFPPMVVHMLAVGEDTGATDTMLEKAAEFYDAEVEATADALTSLIEPLMIAFLGGVVGFVVVAMYLPMFSMFNHL